MAPHVAVRDEAIKSLPTNHGVSCLFFFFFDRRMYEIKKNRGPFWGTIRPIVRSRRAKSGLSPETLSNLRHRPMTGQLNLVNDKLQVMIAAKRVYPPHMLPLCDINGGISPPLFLLRTLLLLLLLHSPYFYEGACTRPYGAR